MIQSFLVFNDWGLLLARVVLGLILVAHGFPKFKHFKGTADFFAAHGFKPAVFWVSVVVFVEFVGGLFLILGLLTQAVALLVAIQFLVIIVKLKWKEKFVGGIEFDLLIFATAVALAVSSGGIYSIDAFWGLFLY